MSYTQGLSSAWKDQPIPPDMRNVCLPAASGHPLNATAVSGMSLVEHEWMNLNAAAVSGMSLVEHEWMNLNAAAVSGMSLVEHE